MNEQTCCFSGHRHLPKQQILHIHNLLVKHILKLIHIGVNTFICGGALGFDTLAALAVLKIRSIYPHIQLILALPSPQQTSGWSTNDIAVYQSILKQANQIIYMSQEHHSGCMHMRNHYMVDNSLYCICYLVNQTGGTAYTVQYAKKKNRHIFNIANES